MSMVCHPRKPVEPACRNINEARAFKPNLRNEPYTADVQPQHSMRLASVQPRSLNSQEGAAVADVVPYTAAEQLWLLVDNTQVAAVPLRIELSQVIAINEHLTVCRHIEQSQQQTNQLSYQEKLQALALLRRQLAVAHTRGQARPRHRQHEPIIC